MSYYFTFPNHVAYSDKEIMEIYNSFPYLTVDEARATRNMLIQNNLRLVGYVAVRFSKISSIELQDLISIGIIGLIRGIDTFDHTRGVKLATYIRKCIENQIFMYNRTITKHRGLVYFEDIIHDNHPDDPIHREDTIGTENDITERRIMQEEMIKVALEAVDELSVHDKRLVELRFGLNREAPMAQKEVAQELGISQSYASRRERKILSILNKRVSSKI